MVTVTSIKDTRIRVRATEELKRILEQNQDRLQEIPHRLANELKDAGLELHASVELLDDVTSNARKRGHLNIQKLREVLKQVHKNEKTGSEELNSKTKNEKQDENLESEIDSSPEKNKNEKTGSEELNSKTKNEKQDENLESEMDSNREKAKKNSSPKTKDRKAESKAHKEIYLYLDELHWLRNFLEQLREENPDNEQQSFYLNDFLGNCQLDLPKNGYLERNPELEARCQQLRMQQQNREYARMTKNVDAIQKNYPEDTFGYQIKAINAQIIAIVQFIFSVVAGFVFGFFGLQLIFGNLDFGFRLLLGVIFALIIALAEIYFLAKKLTEYDDALDNDRTTTSGKSNNNHPHKD